MDDFHFDEYLTRVDQLTGCKNLIAFAEAISSICSKPIDYPLSLIVIDINSIGRVNRLRGFSEGNKTLRWIALLAQGELQNTVYRIDGDEFVAIMTEKSHEQNGESGYRVFQQLNHRAEDFGLQIPLAKVSVIHYFNNERLSPADFFTHIYCSIVYVKRLANATFKVFQLSELDFEDNARWLHRVSDNLVSSLINLGTRLDDSLEMAFIDPTTGLPNQHAAQNQLSKIVASASHENSHFCLLLIDGDDLHRYNEISYADGDEMIRLLGKAIKQNLRPEDFLARWRVGDEFLVLLPDVDIFQGVLVGERICKSVSQASKQWKLPVTVSIGVVAFPEHGDTPEELFHAAELANSISKKNGKNRVTPCITESRVSD